ncbi:uncharacterized protein EAF01_001238 [Botrytis porri]|uniref:uncharacterized protein n=1 Tax=Botrytis porri TaxID=87229 RepID=UPI00190120B6|nr:uncharacterized protein EAF01_001238 [Botrytis porri]KAF7912217.1 hypothetical protein EAF01_001238 [Botrytis porri]
MRSEIKFLERFLSSLKQFVAIYNRAEFPPNATMEVDYGFMNCQNFEETCNLLEIFKRLLEKANPLVLHQAWLTNKLFKFAQTSHHMDESQRRLMRNLYPSRWE